jgi:hypothetical protein
VHSDKIRVKKGMEGLEGLTKHGGAVGIVKTEWERKVEEI